MSSPFGGSKAATMLNMAFCLTPVFADINPLGGRNLGRHADGGSQQQLVPSW
jgi:hypothetical protein